MNSAVTSVSSVTGLILQRNSVTKSFLSSVTNVTNIDNPTLLQPLLKKERENKD